MSRELEFAQELIDFIYDSPSPFHATKKTSEILLSKGFSELNLRERWDIKKGGKYYVTKNDSALVAFIVGNGDIEKDGFKLIGGHTDAPGFKVKPSPEMNDNGYIKLNTEVYGGPILNTWMDRPLSIAGRVTLKGNDILYPESKLININKPILIIPNIAIHMNRKINEGIELNKQKDTLPILGLINEEFEKENYLINILAKELNIESKDIIDFDLYLYEYEKGSIIGINNEFISSGRLDDLAMVHAGISALCDSEASRGTNVMICFDNEEIGSRTKQGAGSPMVKNVLERIVLGLGKDKEDFFRALYSSFIISADMAHPVHPNAPEKHDPNLKPKLNSGPVIKINANQNYTTDSDSDTVFEMICKRAEVPYQKFVNRSDARGGSTIGPISSTQLDIRSVDIGNPMLAMHSVRELGGVLDHYYVFNAFKEFYKI